MAMDNCPRCGKIFNKLPGVRLCEACRQAVEDDFETCYQYLRDHPNSTVPQVSEATGVEERQILEFYRTGRLLTGEAGIPCERCGKPATRGRYCVACADKLARGLKGSESEALGPSRGAASESGARQERRDFSHKMRVDL